MAFEGLVFGDLERAELRVMRFKVERLKGVSEERVK